MKKILLIVAMLFVFACVNISKDITQKVEYDNMTNTYSVTTSFNYPNNYSSCVYCEGCKIDSMKLVEMNKAKEIQETMIEYN